MKNNSGLPKNVQKYLAKYSSGTREIFPSSQKKYKIIICVPAIAEFENLKKLFNSLKQCSNPNRIPVLLLISINNPVNAADQIRRENLKSLDYFSELIASESSNNLPFDLAIVDAATPGRNLPDKFAGAGLARKVGLDLALTKFDYNLSGSNILVNLDADCIVDTNYFEEIERKFRVSSCRAAAVNFRHTLSENKPECSAIINYEIFLRYYVLGLKFAGSPYAFHSIGSTMICDHETYLKAGGMNKKKAGEDFYFMEKIAKFTRICTISGTTVYPSSRPSWRVPFGTGQRVKRFLANERNEYKLYSPNSFVILKKWIDYFYKSSSDAQEIIYAAGEIHPGLQKFLEITSFPKNWEKIILHSSNIEQLNKQKSFWFDGFRTLKLIHYLRDSAFPDENMFDSLDKIFIMSGCKFNSSRSENIPNLDIQMDYLKFLRTIV